MSDLEALVGIGAAETALEGGLSAGKESWASTGAGSGAKESEIVSTTELQRLGPVEFSASLLQKPSIGAGSRGGMALLGAKLGTIDSVDNDRLIFGPGVENDCCPLYSDPDMSVSGFSVRVCDRGSHLDSSLPRSDVPERKEHGGGGGFRFALALDRKSDGGGGTGRSRIDSNFGMRLRTQGEQLGDVAGVDVGTA